MASSNESINVKLETPIIDKTKCGMCGRQADSANRLEKFCNTCPTWLCANCVQGHMSLPALKTHQLSDDQMSQTPVYTHCPRHDRSFLMYYCRTCDSPVCADCRLGTDHQDHKFVEIDVKVSENKQLLEEGLMQKRELKKEMGRVESETKAELAEAEKQLSGYELAFIKIIEDRQKKNKATSVKYLEQLKDASDDLDQKIRTATTIQKSPEAHQSVTDLSLMSAISDDVIKAKPSYDTSVMSVISSFMQASVDVILEEMRNTRGAAKKSWLTIFRVLIDDDGDKELRERVKRNLQTKPVNVYTHQTLHKLQTDCLSIVSDKWIKSYKQWLASDRKPFPPRVEHCTQDCRLDNVVFLAPFDAQLLRAVFGCHQPLPTASTHSIQQQALAASSGRNWYAYKEKKKLHVFQIRKIKSIGDVEGSVETKIFHWDEKVCGQNAQVYYHGKDVTRHVAGQKISTFSNSLSESGQCRKCGNSLFQGCCTNSNCGSRGVNQTSIRQYDELCIKDP